jgi:hypothetical protein
MKALLVVTLAMAAQTARPATPDCTRLLAAEPRPGVVPLCEAEGLVRGEQLRTAAEHYARAADLFSDPEQKVVAYEALARVYSRPNLNLPRAVNFTLQKQ